MRIVDLLKRNVASYPDRVAVAVVGGRALTFAELGERVRRLANGFAAAGVGRGDRVALMARNGLVYFDVYLATAYLGAAAVPINTQLADPEIEYVLADAEPVLTIAGPDYVERVRALPSSSRVIDASSAEYDELLATPRLTDIERATEDDVALIIYTSGTTGRPKGVCLTQRGLAFNGLTMALVQEFRHDDVYMSTTPLYHAATGTRVASMLADGQTHVVMPSFDVESFLRSVGEHGVTITVLVPAQLRQILDHPSFGQHDLSSLRLIVYGAAPTVGPLIRRAHEAFGCGLYQGYGISECVTNLTGLLPSDHEIAMADRPELLESCGRPVQGVRIEIRDDAARAVEVDEVGEIWVRTEKVMAGYWRDPDRTADAIVDGWFRTGDLGRRDADGYLYIVGRAKDMIISGGVNLYPSEIEAVLHEHPAVAEVAVVGRADEEWGERPVAVLELRSEVPIEELRALCVDRLAKIKIPDDFVVVDSLPRTATGKVRKVELREQLREVV